MKILKSENQNFFKDLEFFLQKRLQQNIKDIDESVKKIITQIIKKNMKLIKFLTQTALIYLIKDILVITDAV